jgi:hypothetical protein
VISRILAIILTTVLALPMFVMTQPVKATTQAATTASAVPQADLPFQASPATEAKKKSKKDKPKSKRVTRTVRRPVTRTFTNPAMIDAPNGASTTEVTANPYPSLITVTGFTNGTILDIDLVLNGFAWDHPSDANFLLVAPQQPSLNAIILSDVGTGSGDGSQFAVSNLTLTLDDEASATPPAPLVTGTFRPTNASFSDTFPAPAPTPLNNSALSTFDGRNPNGTWQLFVVDDSGNQDPGRIAAGWSLRITADVDVQERVKVKRDKKKRKKG